MTVYSGVYSRRRSKKTSKLRVTGLCEGNSQMAGEFPVQRASNAENVSMWWRHHDRIHSVTLSSLMHDDVYASVIWVTTNGRYDDNQLPESLLTYGQLDPENTLQLNLFSFKKCLQICHHLASASMCNLGKFVVNRSHGNVAAGTNIDCFIH